MAWLTRKRATAPIITCLVLGLGTRIQHQQGTGTDCAQVGLHALGQRYAAANSLEEGKIKVFTDQACKLRLRRPLILPYATAYRDAGQEMRLNRAIRFIWP